MTLEKLFNLWEFKREDSFIKINRFPLTPASVFTNDDRKIALRKQQCAVDEPAIGAR
jgi:hypothetical protein